MFDDTFQRIERCVGRTHTYIYIVYIYMKDTNMRNMNRVEQIWVSLMQHRPLSHMLLSSLFFWARCSDFHFDLAVFVGTCFRNV